MEAFSPSDKEEIKFSLGMDDFPADGTVNFVNPATDEPEGEVKEDPAPETPDADNPSEGETAAPTPPVVETDFTQAKDIFYDVLNGASAMAAEKVGQADGLGKPYQSLQFEAYGPVSRAATDQLFDNLCKVSFFRRMLTSLNDNSIREDWGAVLMLLYVMQKNFRAERVIRLHEIQTLNAAQETGDNLKADTKSDLKAKPEKEAA